MSPPASNEAGMETRVALVEKEVGIVYGIFQKFESALEKMTEVSTSMQKLLAVHDQRIQERERAEASILESIERRRDEYARNAEKVSQKMEEMANELRKQVKEELEDLGDDMRNSMKELQDSQKEMLKKVEEKAEAQENKYGEMEKRVRALENWRWIVAGGGAVIGFILAKWNFFSSLLQAAGT